MFKLTSRWHAQLPSVGLNWALPWGPLRPVGVPMGLQGVLGPWNSGDLPVLAGLAPVKTFSQDAGGGQLTALQSRIGVSTSWVLVLPAGPQ